MAYGSGKRVCILLANTLIIQQLTEEFESEISSIAWARTGGRISVGMNGSIIILVPTDLLWNITSRIEITGIVRELSWSFFGDCLLGVSDNCSLWLLDSNLEATEIWRKDAQYKTGRLSPDGRLIAFFLHSRIDIYYKDTEFSVIHLNHQSNISWIEWKDISTLKLYTNSYNPNSLIVASVDGWIKVWSEYYSPTGLGFNIVFQRKINRGIAGWIININNMENHISLLALKQYALKKKNENMQFSLNSISCLARDYKTQPENLLYGAVMKERIPVEWLVICEETSILFYCCEGLGSYPVTAITFRMHLEIPMKTNIWSISNVPLYIIKEGEEIQLFGVNHEKDFVRWRKKFDGKNDDEFELTVIRGGHDETILEINCHKTLPLICTVDGKGLGRIWYYIRGTKEEVKAVQNLVHWGILQGKIISARWLDTVALILTARHNDIAIFKWNTPLLKDVKMPSITWEPQHTLAHTCIKIDVSKIEVNGNCFNCNIVALGDKRICVWKLDFKNKEFSTTKIWEEENIYIDCKLYSYMSDSTHCKTHLYTLKKNLLTSYDIVENLVQVSWEKIIPHSYSISISNMIAISSENKILFVAHDGSDQGQLDNLNETKKILFFTQESSECLVISNKNILSIMVRIPLKIVGESEMEWKHVTSIQLKHPVHLFSLNCFHHFILSHDKDLQVYVNEDNFKFSSLLNSISDPKPLFHPLFLLELLRVQKENLVKVILNRLYHCIEDVHYTLNLELEDFLTICHSTFNEEQSLRLKEKINEKCLELPGIDGDIMIISQLIGIVDSVSIIENQSRSLDEYAAVFFLNVKMFKYANEQKIPSSLKPMCLTSMEIAWALHSEQQDTLFQILFNNITDWNQMKMYGIGIWVKSQVKLKKLIEDIAMNDFRKNKEPKNISLWYMALGKKNILTELFKKDAGSAKIYNFLKNDFTTKEWQIKAQKNAYELRKQMKYEMSAAFFILGGEIESAIEVLAESMFDPQLALVIARLKEGEKSMLYQKVVKDYFLSTSIKEKDPWLASISYTLLGNYSESFQCILSFPESPAYVPKVWSTHTFPTLSGFHPSLQQYLRLLQNNIMVKRDCENKGINLDNLENIEREMANRSAKAYLRGGLPILALCEILKSPYDYNLIDTAVKGYLTMITKNCKNSFDSEQFKRLGSQVRYCSDKFNIPIQRLIDFVSDIFYKKDLRHYQFIFLASCGLAEKGPEVLLHQASLVHIILSRFSRDPCFGFSTAGLETLSEEMRVCMGLLTASGGSLHQSKQFKLMHIHIAIYIAKFLQCYQSGSCISALNCLQALDTYLNSEIFGNITIESKNRIIDNGIVGTWLRYLMTNKLLKILEKFKCREIDIMLEESLEKFNLFNSIDNTIECALGPGRGLKKRAMLSIAKLRLRLKSMLRRILLRVNNLVSNENIKFIQKITDVFSVKDAVLAKELSDYFENFEEYRDFDLYFEGNSQVYRLVQASAQSISTFIYEKPGKVSEALEKEGFIYQESIQENVNLFKNGLELFKSKDPIIGFAINSTDKKNLVAISNSKKDKIREVSIEQCLIFKKYSSDLELETEDPETYTECMKQFDNMSGNTGYIFNPSISASLHHLYSPQNEEFEEEMRLPPALWHRSPLKSLLASLSSFKSRQDKVEKIASHPMLPLYVTGNELLTLWQYNRYESLQDFATSSSTTSKIISIKFNSFGDKLGACDQQGNFYLYKFDLQPTSFQPQLTLKNFSGLKASNFCFLNLGSVIATTGNKSKDFLSIYDTLLPPNRPPIHTENIGGKLICFLSRYQQLIISGKKGKLLRYDLRMREVVETFESKHEHITEMKLGPNEITFITGGSEGMVKIWDARGSTVREVIDVSRKSKNKAISQIECIDNTLFVSSHDGGVRLLRIIQQ